MERHEVLADVARELTSLRDGDPLVRAVRRRVAIAAHEKGRLLGEDEIARIASSEWRAQVDYDPVPNEDGETIDVTDVELESLDESERVTVGGMPYVVVCGKAYRASVRPDGNPARAAAQVASEQRLAVRTVKLAQGLDILEDELWEADGLVCCPICGTSDCTLVYDDSFGTTYHCNVCNRPFTVEPEPASLMFEDELIPEEDLVMCCDPHGDDGVCVTVWHGDEPLVDVTVASIEEARILGSRIVNAYDGIRRGVTVANVHSGGRISVDGVSGDEVTSRGMVASRSAIAASVATGDMMVVDEPIEWDVSVGDSYTNGIIEITVTRIENGEVEWVESNEFSEETYAAPLEYFERDILDMGGFDLA